MNKILNVNFERKRYGFSFQILSVKPVNDDISKQLWKK